VKSSNEAQNDIKIDLLWVDDEPEFVSAHKACLSEIASNLEWAADGQSALEKTHKHTFDLLITDLQMPPGQWGGLWLIEELKCKVMAPPVIVLSGRGTVAEAIDAVRKGAINYVMKEKIASELKKWCISAVINNEIKLAEEDYSIVNLIESELKKIVLKICQMEAQRQGMQSPFNGIISQGIINKATLIQQKEPGRSLEECLFLIDYRTIIVHLWNQSVEFSKLHWLSNFEHPKMATKWLVELNELRRVIMHPTRGNLTRIQRYRLREIREIFLKWKEALSTDL